MCTERLSNSNDRNEVTSFGFVMVRPDGMRLSLDEAIIDRIESADLAIVKRKMFILTDTQVDKIYLDLTDRDFYPEFKRSLVGRHVMGILIGGKDDAAGRLMEVKGTVWDNEGTVRGDFSLAHLLTGNELELFRQGGLREEHLPADVATDIMRYDRMHCEEDDDGTRKAVDAVYTEDEINEAATRFSQLPAFLGTSPLKSGAPLGIERPL